MTNKDDLVAGRYRLVGRIGRGAMGVVWRAHDERLDRTVAVKLLSFDAALAGTEGGQADERVMREARLAAKLQHPNAIAVHDVVEHEGRPCLVLEYLPSESLSAVMAERGALPPDEVAKIGAQLADALAAAHEVGIVHRDIKPDNVLIAPDGTVKITDFGISKAIGDATMTSVGVIAGTPAFLAPEVAGGGKAGFPSDVFSLGATLYAATEGVPPFDFDDNTIALLLRVASGNIIPPRQAGPLAPMLIWMLRADPNERPTMRQAQEHLAKGKPPPHFQPRITATMTLPPPKPRRRGVLMSTMAILLVAIGLVVGLVINKSGNPQQPTGFPNALSPLPSSATAPPSVGCEAVYVITNSWNDGYQAEVTVRNSATHPLDGWTVTWTLPGGQKINDLWNGTLSQDGKTVRVAAAQWNGDVDKTTSFGFIAGTTGPNPVKPPVQCIAD
ncbi:serine/threonine protein kinase [Kibdelosporangium banguiense]|uniref:non-specific serine/threonine protein kinase n=1 Tax=Kibdelosporangium banguiense TaxID=1365924 RepID=A0ABS4TLX1_9PSEU|nr:protein kinase [Kibdelosporangium banguiense]MBP2325395.1 serine/threonine protein kinase [Kibdelosporangium banguiense]